MLEIVVFDQDIDEELVDEVEDQLSIGSEGGIMCGGIEKFQVVENGGV